MNRTMYVYLDDEATKVGVLRHAASGNRESSSFEYDPTWLTRAGRFPIDPALPLVAGSQFPTKGTSARASAFFGCFADSEPDGWGKIVIGRDRAKQRKEAAERGSPVDPRPLDSMDYLLAVDDVSRVGALRLRDAVGVFHRSTAPGQRGTPPLIALKDLLDASWAVECHTETAAELRYLRGHGTSLGGMRPKASVLDEDGTLSIGKFPSVGDERAVTKGEVLALRLAALAGLDAAQARVVYSEGVPIALVRRFDRVGSRRLMYVSARTLMGVTDDDDHTYTEIADTMRTTAHAFARDARELWKRMVLNILITNVDDHLNNHGFLHVEDGQWQLAPAFDVNPFPDKAHMLKTWIHEDSGQEASIAEALRVAGRFNLKAKEAREALGEVEDAVARWREVARERGVEMTDSEADQFADAFEHPERTAAQKARAISAPGSSLPPSPPTKAEAT
ncbi:type II toxin-antitoxin system HipA family toxin [Methylobacterium oxalidis]|uniref:type II toxin-antitoxin system HipA family toxin n=1 Tax=Methylobacterium oxalidis TaxID=944322 RepID=UPI003314F750